MPTTESFHGTRVFPVGQEPRPITTEDYSVVGAIIVAPNADEDEWPLDTAVELFDNETAKLAALGTGGNVDAVFDALIDQHDEYHTATEIVAVRVAEGAGETAQAKLEATIANIVGSGATFKGVHAFKHARKRPKILIAPGYMSQRISGAKNPVAAELAGIAARMRGIYICDCPATTKDAAAEYAEDFPDDKRAYLIEPGVLVSGPAGTPIFQPASGRVAGMFVRRDKAAGGPHKSPSNQSIGGIVGASRPISYYDAEPDSEANWLNQQHIATIKENFILWGNHTMAADPLERFVNVVRTEDAIDGAVIKAFNWAIDANLDVPLGSAILHSLDDFLAEASAKGWIIDGRCWFDRSLNTNASMASGILRIEYDREPYAPLEDLQFGARRNVGYYDQVAEGIARIAERISSTRSQLVYTFGQS